MGSEEKLIGEVPPVEVPRSPKREGPAKPEHRPLRRGEQGKSPDEIANYQKSGFVMSGSRSSRLNMLREMQEAESEAAKKKDLMTRLEQRSKKEDEIMDGFRKLLMERRSQGLK